MEYINTADRSSPPSEDLKAYCIACDLAKIYGYEGCVKVFTGASNAVYFSIRKDGKLYYSPVMSVADADREDYIWSKTWTGVMKMMTDALVNGKGLKVDKRMITLENPDTAALVLECASRGM